MKGHNTCNYTHSHRGIVAQCNQAGGGHICLRTRGGQQAEWLTRFSKRLKLSQTSTKLKEKSSRELNNQNIHTDTYIHTSVTKYMGNMIERRSSRNRHKTQSKKWPEVVYLSDDQRRCPIGIWSWMSLCKTKSWGFHIERAHGSAPGRRSHWMGAWGGAAGLIMVAAHRCRMQLHAFITEVRLFLHGVQESCALQLCNEPLPFFLFLGSQFLSLPPPPQKSGYLIIGSEELPILKQWVVVVLHL